MHGDLWWVKLLLNLWWLAPAVILVVLAVAYWLIRGRS